MLRYRFSVYSHGFTVRLFYANDKAAILEFSKDLAVFDQQWVPKLRRKVTKVKAVFATASMDRMEYGFLIADFNPLIMHLRGKGYKSDEMEIIDHTPIKGADIELELADGVKPRDDEQVKVTSFLLEEGKKNRVLNLRAGGGKEMPMDTRIKVPGGWSTMGEMKVGMDVTSRDGTPTKVTGVYPQGIKKIYRLTFSDGRSVEAGAEHQWSVRHGNSGDIVTTTSNLITDMAKGTSMITIPLVLPEKSPEVDLEVSPYLRGVIGDICGDMEGSEWHLYEHLSPRQTIDLIRGIMDAGGAIDTTGNCVYTTKYRSMAIRLQYLIRSIGGTAELTDTEGEDCFPDLFPYTLKIEYRKLSDLFGLSSKKEAAADACSGEDVRLTLVSIEYVGDKEAQCIAVDHPDRLYVTNDFIVTHNTFMTLNSIAHFKTRTALIMGASHIKTWQDSMKWVFKDEKNYCVVRGRESLKKIIQLSLAEQNEYKLIYISIATLRKYITDYLATGEMIENVHPRDLFTVMGVGYRVVDEAHQSIHAIAIQNIFSHVNKSLYLSATLVTEDPFLQKQYAKMFPLTDQFKDGNNNQHARGISFTYNLKDPSKVKCSGGKGYSHVVYEQWIMSKGKVLANYIEMIEYVLEGTYIRHRDGKQKALIFCSTTDLCKLVADQLRTTYGDRGFTVSDYVSSHDPSVLYDNDIVVSTPMSAGTGVDIEDLRVAINTVALRSIQLNQQICGRLRPLKNYPDVIPDFVWFNCADIPKHMEYNVAKLEQLSAHTKEIKESRYNRSV